MHTRRQWMVTHEWMVKPMPQTEWIEAKGHDGLDRGSIHRPSAQACFWYLCL